MDPAGTQTPERAPLTRQRVLQTALELVDANGLDALSMRKLGAELGVDAMAVYKHVVNKDALLDGLVEQLWAEIRDTLPHAADWTDQLRGFAHTVRTVMRRHPQAASLLLSRCVLQVPELEVYASLLDTLKSAGFDEATSARAAVAINSYAIAQVSNELSTLGGWRPEPDAQPTTDPADPWQGVDTTDILLWLGRILPPGTPTRLVNTALAVINTYLDADDFDASLDIAIHGLRQLRDHA